MPAQKNQIMEDTETQAVETNSNVRCNKVKFWFKGNLVVVIVVAIVIAVLIGCIVYTAKNARDGIAIGTSIIRDVNITLISTMATLLGLYVTAFIFLYDSLKTRSREDATLRDAIDNILASCRRKMFLFSIGTILAIIIEVGYNISLGDLSHSTAEGVEDITINIGSGKWWLFIASATLSVIIIAVIICASRDIMDSDKLICDQADHSLDDFGREICTRYDYVVKSSKNIPIDTFYNITQNPSQKALFNAIKSTKYALSSAYLGLLKEDTKTIPYVAATTTNEEFIINFGKTVRLIEMIIMRICDNNIDKSIMTGSLVVDSMESGFKWLYAKKSGLDETILDIRDENRFLDFLKYQLLREQHYKNIPFNNLSFEKDFAKLRETFSQIFFGVQGGNETEDSVTQKNIIKHYKDNMRDLISEFFDGYRCLIGYRDALVHRSSVIATKQQDTTDPQKGKHLKKHKKEKNKDGDITPQQVKILSYAVVLKRALIDRFTSFVKINDLNLGNSTLSKGWFNYSELSESNFTHSSFRFARLENAIMRKCDLSTCNFVCADASNTDFSESNFSYSNMTGMDLSECILNKSQMDSVLFRDERLDSYKGLTDLFDCIPKSKKPPIIDTTYEMPSDEKKIADLRKGSSIADIIRTKAKGCRSNISDDIAPFSIKSLLDTVIHIFPTQSNAGTSINELEVDAIREFFDYRFHSKINDEIVRWLDEARTEEEKEDQTKKRMRESWRGKVFFPVARLVSATINDVSLKETDFSHIDMSNASFRDSDLSGADMYYTRANSTTFFHTNLNQLDAFRVDFTRASFHQANMIEAVFSDCTLQGCNFKEAILIDAKFINSTAFSHGKSVVASMCLPIKDKGQKVPAGSIYTIMESVREDLDGATGENILQQNCVDCEFDKAIANNIALVNCNMQRSNFHETSMRDCLLFNLNLRRCDFSKAYMSNCMAVGVSFYQANIKEARLTMASIFAADFVGANLSEANLTSASLERVIFEETNLNKANLSSAAFKNCTFSYCSFDKTILANAKFENVVFDDIDFSTAIGLQQAIFVRCIFTHDRGNKFSREEDLRLTETTNNEPCVLYREGENEFGQPVYSRSANQQ